MSTAITQTESRAKNKSSALAFVPRVMDLEASAHYLSIGVWSVRELIWAGKIPTIKIPRPDGEPIRRVLILRDDLDAFIEGLPKETEGS